MEKKIEDKYYFKDEDATHCYSLSHFYNDAKLNGLDKIELIEAIPSDIYDYVWCTYYGEVAEKSECNKKSCPHYESKSGRGKCINKGKLYNHGEKVIIKILELKQL